MTNEALQEELSAYLDGELDSEHRHRVEERLARDPEFRAEFQRLQRAWDMLDKLPQATVSDAFTRSTIEMVAVAAEHEARTQSLEIPRRNRRAVIIGGLGVAMAAAAGFIFGTGAWSNPNRQLLDDLPVIEKFELYRHADSVEFLRKLDQSQVFDEETSDGK